MQKHPAAESDSENLEAFLWNHFFGGEPLLKPPKSSHKVDKDKLRVSVSFNDGPQPISGRIWWIYDRAPEGSVPFLHIQIPEDQWMDMECDAKTGEWTATIPLKDGFYRIDFFSNHGHKANGYKQYLSSPFIPGWNFAHRGIDAGGRLKLCRSMQDSIGDSTMKGIWKSKLYCIPALLIFRGWDALK